MKEITRYSYLLLLLLFLGSGLTLSSCRSSEELPEDKGREKLLTMQADSLVRIVTDKGMKSYRFETPLMERYEFAKEPYSEFRKGVFIETFKDSTQQIESTLISDYAIFFEDKELWEAKGNVVATNQEEGYVLETQQLFWNRTIGKIYSNVDTRITQGTDVMVGVGFVSDEKMVEWEFRRPRGRMEVEFEPTRDTTKREGADQIGEPTDSTQVTVEPKPVRTPRAERAVKEEPETVPLTPEEMQLPAKIKEVPDN